MIQFQKEYTTPEQSKRLLTLGVPIDSADMFWSASDGNYPSTELVWDVHIRKGQSLDRDFFKIYNMNEFQVIPCWSVGRLVEMWEKCVGVKFDRWSRNGVLLPLIQDCIEHIEFALNPYTKVELDFSKLED